MLNQFTIGYYCNVISNCYCVYVGSVIRVAIAFIIDATSAIDVESVVIGTMVTIFDIVVDVGASIRKREI